MNAPSSKGASDCYDNAFIALSFRSRSQALLGNARVRSSASRPARDRREAELPRRAFPSRAWERGSCFIRLLFPRLGIMANSTTGWRVLWLLLVVVMLGASGF